MRESSVVMVPTFLFTVGFSRFWGKTAVLDLVSVVWMNVKQFKHNHVHKTPVQHIHDYVLISVLHSMISNF